MHGPHDEAFHNLWNQLRDEHDNLTRKGYTGEGFLSTGHKLGGGRIPMHEARRRARAAAEKRATLSAGSGQRLGGVPMRRGQDIRKVIADAAARRMAVTKGCASGTTSREKEREIVDLTNKRGVRTKAGEDDANEEAIMIAYIDLVQEEERERYGNAYVPPSRENPAGSRGIAPPGRSTSGAAEEIAAAELARLKARDPTPPVPEATKPRMGMSSSSSSSSLVSEMVDLTDPALYPVDGSWACGICTLVNPPTHLACDACGIDRPDRTPPRPLPQAKASRQKPSSVRDSNAVKAVRTLRELEERERARPSKPLGWLCERCGQFMEMEWWTCANCGSMKTSS